MWGRAHSAQEVIETERLSGIVDAGR